MQLQLFCVGRMKKGPERELADRYTERLASFGPQVGLTFSKTTEIAESRAASADQRKAEESGKCLQLLEAPRSALFLLDERGKNLSSRDFAAEIGTMRDSGIQNLIVAIGGPDGHDPQLRDKADLVISFGKLTWPHQIVRILAAEQLYRAAAILANHPYHRD